MSIEDKKMGLNFSSTIRKALMGVIFSVMLIPALVSASTEYKGTETVNINKANASTLAAYLKGVGPTKAEAIVKYRKSNGSFKKIDDLKNVPGIGEETYKDMKKNVSTSRGKSVAPDGYKMGKANSSSSKKKTTKKSSSSSSSKTSSTSSKNKSSKIAETDKKASTKKTSSKKSSTSKKTDSKKATPKKKTTSKKTSTKTKTTKKKPTKKKTTKKKTTKDKK
ncbi:MULTISPECIES: ComEA family DNA-binding protein [unclassified Cocleimonas]|uniref:ComEA family DNA-binding protein n=1 Tax=unclassified Cocleimonas TaxID=2639732 RepID=UPI003FA39E46